MQTIQITKKVYEVNLQTYVDTVISKNTANNKPLTPQQIRFLAYPFITSVFWAKRKGKRVTIKNTRLYYNTLFKQLSLNLN